MSDLRGKRTLAKRNKMLVHSRSALQKCAVVKIPCNECGALILLTTAESTGGLCMACKQGIRKSMDASRAYYESQKTYDPFRELWESLVKRSSLDGSLANLSAQEQKYFAVTLLEGEVYNGGFDQFFSNSSGDYYYLAVDGLEELGAFFSLDIVKEAADTIFGKRGPPVDRSDRWRMMGAKTRRLSEVLTRYRQRSRLERLDKQFWEDPDHLVDLLRVYAEEQSLIGPFLKDPSAS